MVKRPDKPVVFVSHAATDGPVVNVIHDEIMRIFAGGVEVFATSVPGTLAPGADWLSGISKNLERASAVIVVISPVSLNRPWIWFEVGASWVQMEKGDRTILPVCVPEIDKGALPEPLSRLQAMSLGKASETKLVFQELVDLFGFGTMKGFRHASLKAKLPRYADLTIAESDLRSGTVYDGPFEGYTDDELAEVIDDQFLEEAWDEIYEFYGSQTFRGALIHFRRIDENLDLPPGTAKRLLSKVATDRYSVKAEETANTIRFRLDKSEIDE